jgi:predicted permease
MPHATTRTRAQLDATRADLRYAWRGLRRTPGFTTVAVLSLAVGIAATVTIFSLANAIFLKPLPVSRPDALVTVYGSARGQGFYNVSYPEYQDLAARRDLFTGVVAHGFAELSLSARNEPERVIGEIVSGNYFSVLGLAPAVGRFFSAAQDVPGTPPVVVLSDALWRRRFAADPAVVGATVVLNGHPATVLGVAPRGFTGTLTGLSLDVWLPMGMHDLALPPADTLASRTNRRFEVVARLAPGVRIDRARSALTTLARQLESAYPNEERDRAFVIASAVGVRPELRAPLRLFVTVLAMVTALVLAVACANVAGLLLVRAAARGREIGIRRALGASRVDLVRQLLAESVVIGVLGGGVGLVLSLALTRLLGRFQPDAVLPIHFDLSPDVRVLAFTLGVAVGTALLFGLAPALNASRGDLVGALKTSDVRGGDRSRLRSALVVAQVALTLVLLVSAGLLVTSLRGARRADVGFDPSHIAVASVDPELLGFDEARTRTFYRDLLARVAALPGVTSTALATFVPLSSVADARPLVIEGHEPPPGQRAPDALYNIVTPGYFAVMGIPLVRGRDFSDRDDATAPRAVIVNEALVRRYWPGADPLGRRLWLPGAEAAGGTSTTAAGGAGGGGRGTALTVVGVARDVRYRSFSAPVPPYVYFPFAQRYRSAMVLHVRVAGDPLALLTPIRRTIRDANGDLPVAELGPITAPMQFTLTPQRLGSAILGASSGVGLVLAAIGLYGVVAFVASLRTREVGVRIALGARPADVIRLVAIDGLRLAALGVAVGLAISLAVGRLIARALYGVSPVNLGVLIGASVVLVGAALAASYAPARRAARVSPLVALRAE